MSTAKPPAANAQPPSGCDPIGPPVLKSLLDWQMPEDTARAVSEIHTTGMSETEKAQRAREQNPR